MIKDLLLPHLQHASDGAAMALAVRLARQYDAHLAALVTVACPMPLATEWGYVPAEVNEQAFEAARQQGARSAAELQAALATTGVAHEVRVAESLLLWPEDTLALHASHCDLAVLGAADAMATSPRFALAFKALLLRSGRPVLVVPGDWPAERPLRRAVIAWTPTPEAARAVHEALPLLRRMAAVTLVLVDPVSTEGGHGERPGADMARHLARHGIPVDVVALPRQGHGIGTCLLQFVADSGADLLVMGGYGHARWREAILGGTTRSVLDGLRTPVLFAH